MTNTNALLMLAFDSPELIIWSVCIGFNVAMIVTAFLKRIEGSLITSLLDANATSEENALTLSAVGKDKGRLLKFFLRDNGSLRSTIIPAGGALPLIEGEKGKRIPDFAEARFYIPEEKAQKAASFAKGALKWYFLPIYAALSVIITICVINLLPILTNF